MMIRILAVLMLFTAPAVVHGQAVLDVRSNDEGAIVYLDSLVLGRVLDGPYSVPGGTYRVTLVSEGHRQWNARLPAEQVSLTEGDTVVIRLDFPARIRIESIPYGAEVLRAGTAERVGRTPVTLFATMGDAVSFRIVKDGFHDETVTVEATERYQRIDVPLASTNARTVADQEIVWSPPVRSHRWLDYAAAGLAVAAGATAVHFKFKADSLYDEYQLTGDPELRPGFRRYDLYSGVALGAMQVGVGVLAVRIILR